MGIIEGIAGFLILLWIIGLFLHIAGGFIHFLLVIAVIIFAIRFFNRKRTTEK